MDPGRKQISSGLFRSPIYKKTRILLKHRDINFFKTRKMKLFCLFICMPILLYAQKQNADISFERGLTWHQIQVKAKAENKFIFVDCYATWCGPCRLMDKNVFTNSEVANYLNNNFISVKVQMDKTASDDEDVKRWYDDALKSSRIIWFHNILHT